METVFLENLKHAAGVLAQVRPRTDRASRAKEAGGGALAQLRGNGDGLHQSLAEGAGNWSRALFTGPPWY